MASGAPRSRFVESVNGLRMHVLEAGTPGQPGVLLLQTIKGDFTVERWNEICQTA